MTLLFAIDLNMEEVIVSNSQKGSNKINFIKRIKRKENELFFNAVSTLTSISKASDFDISIFKECGKNLILMFDGVDEVTDYKELVKSQIKSLLENFKLKKILITTRNSLKEELEDYFETISFNLNSFDTEDQINFLIKSN